MGVIIRKKKSNQALLRPVPLTRLAPLIVQITFTAILILIGIWLTGIYFGHFPINMAKLHGPIEILLLVGLVIGISGLLLLPSTLTNLLVYSKKTSIKFRYPDSPWYWDYNWNTISELKDKIDKYIKYYNEKRPQWGLKRKTPVEYRSFLS